MGMTRTTAGTTHRPWHHMASAASVQIRPTAVIRYNYFAQDPLVVRTILPIPVIGGALVEWFLLLDWEWFYAHRPWFLKGLSFRAWISTSRILRIHSKPDIHHHPSSNMGSTNKKTSHTLSTFLGKNPSKPVLRTGLYWEIILFFARSSSSISDPIVPDAGIGRECSATGDQQLTMSPWTAKRWQNKAPCLVRTSDLKICNLPLYHWAKGALP